ncbi:hypothetical protein [Stigmatella aurantiaca]|uniref:Uncharacterized protein n=1 Tax=Stigmatella aurantiaca (strain DW4/3-1) TaxID=378806 RepID=Q09D47_STIAD|nr:hypothetical protein [Stigmatella aurantiaca]ADO67863.1 uncharacterized protein STAUR_0054 [Stigmatella aurantiaca DW4/3-1]EAU69630.1 hypothetical protein STIAU_2952 [Stigmatella aurantiaca DW4/3-1]
MVPTLHRLPFRATLRLLALLIVSWTGLAHAQATFVGGTADNFALPTEPVSPSAGLLTWIANNYAYAGSRPYDQTGIDRYFATTLAGLKRAGTTCGGTLRITVRNGDSNDSLNLWFTDGNGNRLGSPNPIAWSNYLSSLGVPLNTTGTIVLDLASLPGIIDGINTYGFLDILVQDDSAVDSLSLSLTRCKSDVYIKDNLADVGAEPGTYGPSGIWSSPDIRVCQTAGCSGTQNPLFGQTNYIYVKLRNTGPNAPLPSSPVTGTLHLYRTLSGGGSTWNGDWVYIGSTTVTVPGATNVNDFLEVVVPWSSVPAPGHYCLLARWDSPTSDPMTFPELVPSNTVDNTIRNNNIAWRNVNVVRLTPTRPTEAFDFRVRNLLKDRTSLADLQVRIPGGASFISRGQVLLQLEPGLWQSWGKRGEGFEIIGEGVVRIVNPSGARLAGLQLTPDGSQIVKVSFSANAGAAPEPFEVQVVQYSEAPAAPGRVTDVGGVTYQITVGPDDK